MKIKNDIVLHTLDKLTEALPKTAPDGAPPPTTVAFADLVSAIREATGVEVPNAAVKGALKELEAAGECTFDKEGRAIQVFRISPERRAAWTKAEQLAGLLGGTANKSTATSPLAGVYLTLEQAEALAARFAKGNGK